MKNNFLLHTTIPNDTLRRICIKNNWFDAGDNTQYQKMFAINDTFPTIRELALIIMICTSTETATLDEIIERIELAHEKYVEPYKTALFIDGQWQFIDELRMGYRIITGLDDNELTDEEIWEYMKNTIDEENERDKE